MEVKLSELTETTKPLRDLEPYPKDKPMGFIDIDDKFMVTVLEKGIVMKKRIPNKYVKHDVLKLPNIELCDF